MNAFQEGAGYIAIARSTPIAPTPLRERINVYAVQRGTVTRYEGRSYETAKRLFSKLTKSKPNVGVLLKTNDAVSRRYVPRE